MTFRPGDDDLPDEVWEKRLYVRCADRVILHMRRADSPWGRHTVWFRDWLRAHPEARRRYEKTKRVLSEANAGKPDHDDYTRRSRRSSTRSGRSSWPGTGAAVSSRSRVDPAAEH